MRYVERNPILAGLVARAEDYPWSSARAHLTSMTDPLLADCFLTTQISDWAAFLALPEDPTIVTRLAQHSRTGRPLGQNGFVERLEQRLGRVLQKRKPGPKPAIK